MKLTLLSPTSSALRRFGFFQPRQRFIKLGAKQLIVINTPLLTSLLVN
jgi:hypothetical protein